MPWGKRLAHTILGHQFTLREKHYHVSRTPHDGYYVALEAFYACPCGRCYSENVGEYAHQTERMLSNLLDRLSEKGYTPGYPHGAS